MSLLKKVLPVLFFFLPALPALSQTDSTCRLRISLLTCSPGTDLYSSWGHTGVRLIDTARNIDVVFNYGTFDDSDPLFYARFTRGIMTYSLSVWSFQDFMREYEYERRSVTEQVLQLDCDAQKKLANALIANAQEANRFYGYHFYQDNCTTRAGDIIIKNAGGNVAFKNILQGNPTFRNLIHHYLDKGGLYWNKLGIDILLGSNLDKKATNEQAMFLPDYLMNGFDSATLHGKPLVMSKSVILNVGNEKDQSRYFDPPFITFLLLLVLTAALSYVKKSWARVTLKIFDISFFLVLGLLGILLLTLWIIRVDAVCRNNFNIFLMLPTHAVMVFFFRSRSKWVRRYWQVTFALLVLLLITWWFLPQQLNGALVPITLIALWRIQKRQQWGSSGVASK
jgi:hypothetical protein